MEQPVPATIVEVESCNSISRFVAKILRCHVVVNGRNLTKDVGLGVEVGENCIGRLGELLVRRAHFCQTVNQHWLLPPVLPPTQRRIVETARRLMLKRKRVAPRTKERLV